jgi:hypothetical protein
MLSRLIKLLSSGWRLGQPVNAKLFHELSAEVLQLFESGKAVALKASIKAALEKSEGGSAEVDLMVDQAKACSWSNEEIEKIRIYAHYYGDHADIAYANIIKFGFEKSDFDMFVLACMALYLNGQFDQAFAILRTRPIDSPEYLDHLDFAGFAGYIALSAGAGIEYSLRYFDLPLKMGSITTSYVTNAYPVYFEAGRLQIVADLQRHIHTDFRDDPQATYALACVELARGYFPEGFRLAESRYDHPDATQFINGDLFDKPRWHGESLKGKRLLVHAEQGLGDLVMCARYLPELVEMAEEVIFECNEVATSLLAPNFPRVKILPIHRKIAATIDFDFWVGAMSLPHFFNSTTDLLPRKNGYLVCPSEHVDYWHENLQSRTLKRKPLVGVAWSGNPKHRADRRRSIKFDNLRPYLAEHSGVNFCSLQTDVPAGCPDNLINFSEELMTLADTAALIMKMDLVITVDTSVVHIAGALGKPTWLLLPYRYDWRWGLEGETNSWYESVKVIRQPGFEAWPAVLEYVFHERLPAYLAGIERDFACG